MTVSSTTNKVTYTGDDLTSVFPYAFKIFADTELVVEETVISTGVTTELTLTTDYTVTGAGEESGGEVTLVAGALASTSKLTIRRGLPLTQLFDLEENDNAPAAGYEEGYDRLVMIAQQLQEQIDRSIKSNVTETDELIFPALSAGKYLTNDGTDLLWEELAITETEYNGTISRGLESAIPASPEVGDIYFATDTGVLYLCESAGTWTEYTGRPSKIDIAVEQASHGFSVGDVLRWDATDYTEAQADSLANSEVIGIVSEVVDTDNFRMILGGYVSGLSGLTAGTYYYLDPSTAGALTSTKPTTVGQIVKPLLLAISTTEGIFVNSYGHEIVLTGVASAAEVKTGTETAKYVSPATLVSHEGCVKGWIQFDGTGTIGINDSYNVSGITDEGTGDYTITWDIDFSSINYAFSVCAQYEPTTYLIGMLKDGVTPAVGSLRIILGAHTGGLVDSDIVSVIAIGDR